MRHRRHPAGGAAGFAALAVLAAAAARADDPAPPPHPAAPLPAPAAETPKPPEAARPAAPAPAAPAPKADAGAAKPAAAPADAKPPAPKDGAAKEPAAKDAAKPAAAPSPAVPAAKPDGPSALRSAIEGALGAPVHGRFTLKWESRILDGSDDDETDHDLYGTLDLRVGDAARDRWSGAVLVRADWDLDKPDDGIPGRAFSSLADRFDTEVSALLYSAYATWRPEKGPVESARLGRQYAYVAETFHFDGAAVETRPLAESVKLRLRAYGGVPVHFYESSPSGDALAGVQATAEPRKGTRVAADYAHVNDDLAGYTDQRDDLAAVSVWQKAGANAELFGRFTWLDGPADFRLRGSVNFPEIDLLVQASYKRLLEDREEQATEFDPYFSALRTYREYHLGDLRAVKGLGEDVQVELGASARELVHDSDEGVFNRETRRVWLTPSVDDLLWKGSTLSAGVESLRGGDERITTWTADLSHRFGKGATASVGTDFALFDYGRLAQGEREHVRTVYARARAPLAEHLSFDVRYTWERDEEETFHAVSAALVFDF